MARLGLLSLVLICGIAQLSFGMQPFPRPTNQQMAEKIATALRDARLLNGTDISIEFRGGLATLEGTVSESAAKQKAGDVVSRIPGVEKTVNSLRVSQEEDHVIPQSATEDSPNVSDRESETSAGEDLKPLFLSIPPTMMGHFLVGKRLMARQQELFESDTLHKIEVSLLSQNKSTPLYDIYCGRKQLVVVSRCGGFHCASFEGRFYNSFQGGVYEWTSGKKTGTQYECEERDVLQLFRYVTDAGGFMTQLYMESQIDPELFEEPIERDDGVKEFRLKQPRYNFLSIAAADDPLWLCELTHQNADGDEVKRVYSRPAEVEQIPESIARESKDVKFEPTQRTVHSLMVYP